MKEEPHFSSKNEVWQSSHFTRTFRVYISSPVEIQYNARFSGSPLNMNAA